MLYKFLILNLIYTDTFKLSLQKQKKLFCVDIGAQAGVKTQENNELGCFQRGLQVIKGLINKLICRAGIYLHDIGDLFITQTLIKTQKYDLLLPGRKIFNN